MNRMEQQPPAKRRPGRPPKQGEIKRAFFQTRIRESLKQRLEEDAAKQGRSLSEEIELRLEASYDRIESRFGGAAGLNMAIILYSSFQFAGTQEAASQGHPEWTADQWLADPECFEEALMTQIDSAWAHHPRPITHHAFYKFLQRLYDRRRSTELIEQWNAERSAEAAAGQTVHEAG
jgi:hypothetical protein